METDVHMLFNCEYARTVRGITDLYQLIHVQSNDTSLDVLVRVFAMAINERCDNWYTMLESIEYEEYVGLG